MNAQERLLYLAGLEGVAKDLLMRIGQGATTGEALVDYSKLDSESASTQILKDLPVPLASLGGFAPSNKKPEELPEEVEIVEEAIPENYISRIRNEFLSEALAKDLINRAKQRKSRAEEEALLIIL